MPRYGSESEQCHRNTSVVQSDEGNCMLTENIQYTQATPEHVDTNFIRNQHEKLRIPFDLQYDEQELSEELKISLENKGIYGWWATSCPSPSPGPITFGDPQRRLIPKADRLREVHLENVTTEHSEPDYNDHKLLADMLRREDKLTGIRCYCHTRPCSPTNVNVNHFWQLQKPMLLLTSLFRIAGNLGQEEMLATSTDVRRTLAHSRLSWCLFDFHPKDTSSLSQVKDSTVTTWLPTTNHVKLLRNRPEELLADAVDSIMKIGNLIYQTFRWIEGRVQPIVTGFDQFTDHAAPATSNKGLPSPKDSIQSILSTSADNQTTIEGSFKCTQIIEYIRRNLNRTSAFFTGKDSSWIQSDVEMDSESITKLERIMKDIRWWEVATLKKMANKRSPIIMTLFEFITLLIPHLGPNAISDSLRSELVAQAENEKNAQSPLIEHRSNQFMAIYADKGLLGYPVESSAFATIEEAEMNIDTIPLTLEAPRLSVAGILDPVEFQLFDRYRDLMANLDENGALPPNIYDEYEECNNSEENWWLDPDDDKKRNLREHLREGIIEHNLLEKKLDDHLLLEASKAKSEYYNHVYQCLPTIDAVQNNTGRHISFNAQLEPKRRDHSLYGKFPKSIGNIFDTSSQTIKGPLESLDLRPKRELGQSNQNLFKNKPSASNLSQFINPNSLAEFLKNDITDRSSSTDSGTLSKYSSSAWQTSRGSTSTFSSSSRSSNSKSFRFQSGSSSFVSGRNDYSSDTSVTAP